MKLKIWIAENGDRKAKALLCELVGIHRITLYHILNGQNPHFENRYRIFKLTGVKINDEDDFNNE